MRNELLKRFTELAMEDERLVYMGSDTGYGILDELKQKRPKQWFMEGIAENNTWAAAAGMASEGRIMYVNTIGSFLVRRGLEQIIYDVGMHNLPVRFLAFGRGLMYSNHGPTHCLWEDMAIMRTIPNMTVCLPADANQACQILEQSVDWPGPMYIGLRAYAPDVTSGKIEIGQSSTIRASSADTCIVCTGATLNICQPVAEELNIALYHLHTVKPLTIDLAMLNYANMLIVEEHMQAGGLYEMLLGRIVDSREALPRIRHICLKDEYPRTYGVQEEAWRHHGLTRENVAGMIKEMRAMD